MSKFQKVFKNLKVYLRKLPLVNSSKAEEDIYIYLVVSLNFISPTLIKEDEGIQSPLYYSSRFWRVKEDRYSSMEKLVFALVTMAQKLRPYFWAYTFVVGMSQPLKNAINKPDSIGELA